jgi:hypothetical protein
VGGDAIRAELYDEAIRRIQLRDFEIGRPHQIEDNPCRAGGSLRYPYPAEKVIPNLTCCQASLLDPRPRMQNIEKQTIGIMCAVRPVFKRTSGFDNDAGGIGV